MDFEQQITFTGAERRTFVIDGLVAVPTIGTGLYHEGAFYRMTDVWFNADNTNGGPLPYGWIVKIELARNDDSPTRDFDPDYYGLT